MAEDRPKEDDVADEQVVEVSRPDVRRFHGNARCTRCKEGNRDCLLERKRGNLHCLTCQSPDECQFRRLVVKEAIATAFTWEELIGDGSAENSVASNSFPRKRLHSVVAAAEDNYSRVPPPAAPPAFQNQRYVSSTYTEPATSQVHGNITASPYATRKLQLPHDQSAGDFHMNLTDSNFPSSLGYDPFDMAEVGAMVEVPRYLVGINTQDPYSLPGPSYGEPQSLNERFTSHRLQSMLGPLAADDPNAPNSAYKTHPPIQSNRSMSGEAPTKFSCTECDEVFNTRSEINKHMARHSKKWTCDHQGCPRRYEGFATKNDLDRHKSSVHRDTSVQRKEYKCVVTDCKDPHKIWDRKDNFKAHVKRMHPDADVDGIVERSLVGSFEAKTIRRSDASDGRTQQL